MELITEFSKEIIDKLDYYVYVYSDPETKQPFYIGKGKGNRVFAHLADTKETKKVEKLKEIRNEHKYPIIEILVHGVDEKTALKVEAAAIDLLGIETLTNEQRGYHSSAFGKINVATLNARYRGEKLSLQAITDDILMIRINRYYRNDMKPHELYDVTRGIWVVNPEKAQKAKYAFAVYDGMIMEVYSIVSWLKAGSTLNCRYDTIEENLKNRYEFVGNIAPAIIRNKYINKSVSDLFQKGEQNPIKYFLVSESL